MIIAVFWSENCELKFFWITREFKTPTETEEFAKEKLGDGWEFTEYLKFKEPIKLPS